MLRFKELKILIPISDEIKGYRTNSNVFFGVHKAKIRAYSEKSRDDIYPDFVVTIPYIGVFPKWLPILLGSIHKLNAL